MAAGAMPDRNHAARVEMIVGGMRPQRVRSRGCVLEGAGIAAARPVDAAIVDIPDRDAAPAEVVGDPVHDRPVGDLRLPAAAMDHQGDGVRAGVRGHPDVRYLQGVGAIMDGGTGGGARPAEQVRPGH